MKKLWKPSIYILYIIIIILIINKPSINAGGNVFIDEHDYVALQFLSTLDKGVVLTHPGQAIAIYPVTGMHTPATIYFNSQNAEQVKRELLDCNSTNATYAYTDFELSCGKRIYENNFRYVYDLR